MGKKKLAKYKKDNKDLIEDTHFINKQKQQAQDLADLKDSDLFVINSQRSQKIKLREDRFKQYNTERSKYERDKIKKLMKKPESQSKKQKKKPEVFDIWNTPEEEIGMPKISKNKKRETEIKIKAIDKIRRVVVPQTGQSYNPPALEHKKVIDQIIVEEVEELKKETQLEWELNPELRPDMQALPEELAKLKEYCARRDNKKSKAPVEKSESDEEDGPTRISVNPPVDRKNALTPKKRKKREVHKQQEKERRREKKLRQQIHKERPLGKKQLKKLRQIREYNKKREIEERERWESEGVVSKPKKLGLYKYSKPKIDFTPEEELPESFRNQKGNDKLIRDQFDSFFRRNILPKEAPPNDRKKIKGTQFKEHNTNLAKRIIREKETEGDKAIQQAREKLRQRKRQTALIRGLKMPKDGKEEEEELIQL
jgi:hypothetical protein